MGANLKKAMDQPGQSGQPGQYSDKAVPPGLLFVQAAKDLCEAAASMQENPVISAFIGATYASLKDMAMQAYPEASAQIQWQDGVGTTGAAPGDPAAAPGAVAPGDAIDEAKGPEIAAEGAPAEGKEEEEDDEFSLNDSNDDEDSDPFAMNDEGAEEGEESDDEDADEDEEMMEDEDSDEESDEDADEDEEMMEDEDSDEESDEEANEDEEMMEDEESDEESDEDADEDEEIMEEADEDEAPPPKAKGKSKGKSKKGSMPDFGKADKKQKALNNLDKILQDTTSSVSSLSDSVSGLVERLKKMTGRVD